MNIRSLVTVLCGVALACCCFAGRAQSLEEYRARLSDASHAGGATVDVVEHGTAASAVAKAASVESSLRFKGYRVCIFFDNGQNARAEAEAARALFVQTYPDLPVYIAYNAPYFTVTAGNCVTVEEAIILMGRVRGVFPKAFPRSEELTMADLLKKP